VQGVTVVIMLASSSIFLGDSFKSATGVDLAAPFGRGAE